MKGVCEGELRNRNWDGGDSLLELSSSFLVCERFF